MPALIQFVHFLREPCGSGGHPFPISLEPGQTYTIKYTLDIKYATVCNVTWSYINKNLLEKCKYLKIDKWYYDFAVKSEGI
jgi:hypothetical protein